MATDFGDELRPPRVAPKLKAAPKIRQIYWCEFPRDAQLPELWKRRPVIVISKNHKLSGAATLIPCSSLDQGDSPWAYKLSTSISKTETWAICDKPYTLAISRLSVDQAGIQRISEAEFQEILTRLFRWLPQARS